MIEQYCEWLDSRNPTNKLRIASVEETNVLLSQDAVAHKGFLVMKSTIKRTY